MANVDKTGGQPRVQQTQAQQKIKRTKEQIGKVVHTIMQLVPNDAATKTKIARIAQELYDYADTHKGAVGKSEFTKLLKEITPENVVGVIMKYNNEVSPDESIVEMMLDEVASSHDDIREALLGQGDGKNQLRGLFTVLLDRAKAVGMDDATIKSYRKQFETQLNKELGGAAFLRSSAKMDEIINTVIQSIRNHIEENNKAAKANGSQKTVPAKAHETKATNTIVARYNKALKDFNKQLKADGWAEDIADAMGRLWGKNYADAVRKDLKIAKEQVNSLKAALAKGDDAFRAEFLNIFGVAYDPANITAYQNAENAYTTALKAKSNEDSFNQAFNVLLKKEELKAEYETLTYPDTGVRTTATKEQVYTREFNKIAELFDSAVKNDKTGQYALLGVTDGKSYVEKAIEAAGAKGKSIDEKYKVLQNIVGKISQSLAQETKKACGGRSFASIQQQYENCYKAAYGLENDILKRVTDYNISQQKGGGIVKGTVVAIAAIGLGILTAGGGTAAIAGGTGAATTAGTAGGTMVAGAGKGAATVSALTALTELSDKLTSKNGLRPEDIGQIAQASLVSGTMCLMFAGQSYAITNLTLKAATAAGMGAETAGYTAAALSTAGFVGTGLGTEYVFQGEISVEGATFTVIMALVSGVMQVKQVYQNARAVEAQIKEQTLQSIADARKQLGFAEDEVINLDKAEKAYKEIAKLHHPNSAARTGDGAMHDAIFAAANNAIEVLRKNAMSINATVTKQVTNPQTSQHAQPKANPTHIPTAEDGAIVQLSHYQAQPRTDVGVYPITVNGVNLNKTITNVNNAVVTSETEVVGESTIINGKDANGNVLRTTVDNGVIKSVQYIDGNNSVSQIMVKDAVVANYVVNANGKGVYTDATGQVISESKYNRLVNDAVNGQTDPVNMPLTPAQNNGATVVELNPQVSAVAASSSGPVANPSAVPSQVTGSAAPTENVYEPVLDNGVGRSNTEIRATYEAVEDVGTLIKEYNFHKQAGGQVLKLTILEDVINQRMTNIAEQARASVVTTDSSELNGMQVTTSKDANGTPVVTTTSTQLHNNKVVAQNVYNSNGISVSETAVDGKVIGSYITTGGEDGVYIDHYGYIITESQFNDAVSTAVAEPAPSTSPAPAVDAKTQAAVDAGLIRMDYINDVENALANPNTQNVVRNTMLRAKTQAELQYFADKFKNSPSTANRYTALKAEAYKDQLPVKPSEETLGMATGQNILPEGEAATKVPQPNTGLSEEFVEIKNEITRLQGELDNLVSPYKKAVAELETQREVVKLKIETGVPEAKGKPIVQGVSSENLEAELARIESELQSLTPPDEQAVTQLEQQIADLRGKAQAKIHELQQELKSYGAGTDRYDQIHMDRIQSQIKALREIAPLDRTNLQEVLQASPDEVFQPVKADNIKGQGISFKPYVPEDPKALAKVTYRAVPLYTEARTVEEMIRIAARDGVKIEMVQDADGNYYPGVKSVWSEGGYFKLDRDSYVVQYGEIPADDPYLDQAWAQQNKYTNSDGKEVVMDCAIVAADKKTAADIMPHSYVKANGAQLSPSDKHNWNGFQAHKDPDGIVNAVAYDEPQELQTLEGKITTDITMGDVEGNVYNQYNDLKKQILGDKLVANPDDPNSQKFIDLVKAGKDDEAIALLREATKASQAPEPAPADGKKPYVKPEMTEASATPRTEVLASAPRTSSSYLDFTDRIMHRTEYKLAKQLQEQGMEVKFGVDGKYSIEIDASQFDGLELLDGNYYHELYNGHTVFEYSYKDGKLVITGQKAGGFASDAERMQFALDMRTKGASYSNQYATGGKTVNTRSVNEIIQSNIDKAKHSSQVLKDNGVTVTKFSHGDAARYKGDTYAPAEIRFTQNGKEYVGEYRGNNVEIIPKSDLEGMLADAIEGKATDKFAIKEFDSASGEYKPVENISQTFAENKPRELKLPRVSGGAQADIVEGWRDFVSESKAVINSAASIDELRTLRDQIKNVENKQAAQELREAYVLKEQELRAKLPESTKAIKNMYMSRQEIEAYWAPLAETLPAFKSRNISEFAKQHNLTLTCNATSTSEEAVFKNSSGQIVRKLENFWGGAEDSYYTYNEQGKKDMVITYDDNGQYLCTTQYFYDENGKINHILQFKNTDNIQDLANNRRDNSSYSVSRIKSKFGIDIDASAIGTTVTDAQAKISKTSNKKSYEKPKTTVMSYSMESDLMASDVQTTKYNSNQERILAEAGFSDGVIDDIVAHGPWGNPKFDAALVEEVKNMIIWMEGEIANGATVNRTLIETAINTFSPGASGGSAAFQRSILANYWNRGTEVYNAYGQKAPGQSTFSWGNLKAKWNKVKNSVKEFYDYKKWEITGKDSGVPRANTEQFSEWSTEKLMNEFNMKLNYNIKDGMTELRAVLTERGYAPNENGYYLTEQIAPEDVAAHPGQLTGSAAPVRADFIQKFGQARSTQDLEAMVNMANTPEECQYIITKLDNPNTKAVNGFQIQNIIDSAKAKAKQLAKGTTQVQSQVKGGTAPAQATPSETGVNAGVGTVQTSFVSDAAQDVHAKIVNGDFGAFGSKSASQVGKELKAYAEKNGLKFIERGSEFELQDANGNVVREAHEGFFDGQWYDHHQTFNADNKITNRFVVDHNGKLQSTVEYFYDENGNQTMSVGYGGKAGTSIMVFEGTNRSQLTIQQFIEKYGFEPTFYREINPNVEFESPIQTGGVTPVSSVAEMEASIKADITPMEADTGIKPFGEISFEEAMPQIEQYAKDNGLTISNHEGLFGDTYDLTNAQGQKVRTIVFDNGKVDIEWNRTFDSNGNRTNETMYDANGKVIETTDFKYNENGKAVASIKTKSGYDQVGVFEYDSNGRVKADYFTSVEQAEAKFGKISHTEILESTEQPAQVTPSQPSSSGTGANSGVKAPVPGSKEAIFDFDYSSEWNPSNLQAWADKNGLTLSYIDNNRIAVFKDSNGHVVRRVTQDWSDKTKVYDDKRAIYDKEGNLIGQLDKYTDETEPEYSFKHPGQTQKTYAKLGSDGLWYENKFVDGRFEKEILPTNPITGMPQVTGVNPEAKIELQVHEAEPAPASFENAGVPETTLSASYVEAPQTVDSSAHPSVNDIVAKYENPDISSFSETTNLPLGNGTRTDYKSGNNLVLTVFRDSNNKITSTLENIYDSNGKYIKTVETKADGSVIETTLDKLNTEHPELQVHEAEPALASFENAGVSETTLSASYVEAPASTKVKIDMRPVEEYPDDIVARVSSQKGIHKVISQETMPNSGRQIEQYVDANNNLVMTVFVDNKTGNILSVTENTLNEKGFITKAVTTYADGSTMEDTFTGDREFSTHLTHVEKDAEGKLTKSINYEDNTSIEAVEVPTSDEPLVIGKPDTTIKHEVGHINDRAVTVGKPTVSPQAFTVNGTPAENVAAFDAYLSKVDSQIVRSELKGDTETFFDKDGKKVKTVVYYDENDRSNIFRTELNFETPQQNGVVHISRTKNQIEVKVKDVVGESLDGLEIYDRGYKEYDLNGNVQREVYANDGAYERIPDTYEVRYKDGKPVSAKQEIHAKDGSKVTTVIDYEKGTNRIEKNDKNWNTYEVSETGINDEPEFYNKQDVIRRSADAWVGFPSMKQAVMNADFDCVSTQIIVETLRKQPDACQKVIKLKNPDGTPRFTPEEAAILILNCRNFLDTPRLMKFMTTPNADGSNRPVHMIWRAYVDSDEFKDATPAQTTEQKATPVDDKVTTTMAKQEFQNQIQKIVDTKGNAEALKAIYDELNNLPDTPENKALEKGLIKCIMGGGQNTEHVADFIKTELTKIYTEVAAKEAALATINKDAVLSDEVYAAAFELSPRVSAGDKRHVAELMKNNAGIVEKMMTYKNPDGSQMFPPKIVAEFFLNCESVIVGDPGRIFTTIESDLFKKDYADWENKSTALWQCLYYQ